MDRRRQKTRQAVLDAFVGLLERKPYSTITVQEIIDEANIGRSTFYAHFETKDELLHALCTQVFDHVFAESVPKEATHDFSGGKGGLEGEVAHVLHHLQESRSYLYGLLVGGSSEVFMRSFKEYLQHAFDSALDDAAPDVPREYLANHLASSLAETVRWWMRHDSYSPDEMARFFMRANPYLDQR